MIGSPPDAPLLVPAVKRVAARTGKVPGAVAADRGYGEAAVDRGLADWVSPASPFPAEAEPLWPARRSSEGGAFVGW
jgi:transposase, IS5 family